MNKKLPISIAVVLILSLIIIISNTTNNKIVSKEKVVPVNSFSVIAKARKASEVGGINPGLINQIKNINTKTMDRVKSQKKSYMEFTNYSQTQLANNILDIEKKHKELNKLLYDNNLKIDPIFEMKPRFLVTMAFYLNLNLTDITVNDIQLTGLNNKQVYTLKTFSESQDFLLLLKRGELSLEHVQNLLE